MTYPSTNSSKRISGGFRIHWKGQIKLPDQKRAGCNQSTAPPGAPKVASSSPPEINRIDVLCPKGGEDDMTPSRVGAASIVLSIAFGFVGGAGSTQPSANDQNLSGTVASKRMA